MTKLYLRLFTLIKICLICLIFCLKSYAENTKTENGMVVVGSDQALVKIEVYSSLTCPHCASFHIKVIPNNCVEIMFGNSASVMTKLIMM